MNSILQKNKQIELKHNIETLRNKMIQMGAEKGYTSDETIKISQKLDKFIAKYQLFK